MTTLDNAATLASDAEAQTRPTTERTSTSPTIESSQPSPNPGVAPTSSKGAPRSELTAIEESKPIARPEPGTVTPSQATSKPSRSATAVAAAASRDAVWYLKSITWPPRSDKSVLVIMQSRNGPCSLICLCNILILRNDIEIRPKNRTSVSYEYLASLVADFLVTKMSGDEMEGLSAALSKLPSMQEGMNINSVWSSQTSFKQLGDGGELKVFELCGVTLVHGWLADPTAPEYEALLRVEDYDAAINVVVAADHLTNGQLVESEAGTIRQGASATEAPDLTEQQKQTIHDAFVIRQFLDANSSQLTYYGLFQLTSTLSPGLYAFFRNSHLNLLLKTPYPDQPLYTLVTDSTFANEPAVVWESLEDVDGGASNFVDSNFIKSSTVGGDYSGATAETAIREAERAMQNMEISGDLALAQQLQAEEEQLAQEAAARRDQRRAHNSQQQSEGTESRHPVSPSATGSSQQHSSRHDKERSSHKIEKKPSKDQCIVM